MRLWLLMGILLAGVLCSGGCDTISNMAGDWGDKSPDKDDVSAIKPGMNSSDVVLKIGKAHRMVEGDLVYAGWQEWIYPTGSLFMYRGSVRYINVKPLSSDQLAVLKNKDKKYDIDLNILEGDRNEGAEAKATDDGTNGIWSTDGFIEAAPQPSPVTRGFVGSSDNAAPK